MEKEQLNKIIEEIDREAELSVKKIEKAFGNHHFELKKLLVDFADTYRDIWSHHTHLAEDLRDSEEGRNMKVGSQPTLSSPPGETLNSKEKTK